MPDGVCPFATQVSGAVAVTPSNVDRVGFCDHTASGFFTTMLRASFWNDPNDDGSNTDAVSVHFAIGRKGEIAQIQNIFDSPFAQGRLGPSVTWGPFETMGSRNPNGYLISTEHEDAFKDANNKTQFVKDSEWTEEQYQADLRVKRWCIEEVKRVTGKDLLRFGIDSLAGHHMFNGVDRSECPGKAWRERHRARLFADLTGVGGGEAPRPQVPALNLNPQGTQRIESHGNFIVIVNSGVPVIRYGSTDGRFPGRISKLFGEKWLWLRTLDDAGRIVAPFFSETEGD